MSLRALPVARGHVFGPEDLQELLDLLAQQEDDGGVQSAHTKAWRARTIQYTPEAHDT